MSKYALVCGINAYGNGSDLYGCVSDAADMEAVLKSRGFAVYKLLDQEATKESILNHLKALVEKTQYGDLLVFHYSGHGCFSGDTEVELLNGTTATMSELHSRYSSGGHFWVYAIGSDGKIVAGRAHSPRITKTAEVVSVELDNGTTVKCTPDHLFMLRSGEYKPAGDLSPGESLMPLYRHVSGNPESDNDYEACYMPWISKKSIRTQRLVAESVGFDISGGRVVHHKNGDRFDNSPENLEAMSRSQHTSLHVNEPTRLAASRERMKGRNREYSWPNDVRKKVGEISSAKRKEDWKNSEYRKKVVDGLKKSWENATEDDPRMVGLRKAIVNTQSREAIEKRKISFRKTISDPSCAYNNRNYPPESRARVGKATKLQNHRRWHEARGLVNEKCEFCAVGNNHKVVSVKRTGEVVPVYDISVDRYHNFALTAGVFVHNSWEIDDDGDEADGRDECLCPVDVFDGNVILDDELHEIFSNRHRGARILFLSDSCHSGTVSRFMPRFDSRATSRKVKFLPPEAWKKKVSPRMAAAARLPAVRRTASTCVLISGAGDPEYSYDAEFEGKPNGAFTYVALKTLAALSAPATYADWHKAIRTMLPNPDFPQSPNLLAAKYQRQWIALGEGR